MQRSAVVLAIVGLQACSVHETSIVDHVHPNGLILRLPTALSTRQISDGFVVQLAASLQQRVPQQVSVTLHRGGNIPTGENLEKKSVAGGLVLFRVDREEGGSGGASHTLTAWRAYADGYVQIVQVTQAEWPSVPDHSLAWTVVAAIGELRASTVK